MKKGSNVYNEVDEYGGDSGGGCANEDCENDYQDYTKTGIGAQNGDSALNNNGFEEENEE